MHVQYLSGSRVIYVFEVIALPPYVTVRQFVLILSAAQVRCFRFSSGVLTESVTVFPFQASPEEGAITPRTTPSKSFASALAHTHTHTTKSQNHL